MGFSTSSTDSIRYRRNSLILEQNRSAVHLMGTKPLLKNMVPAVRANQRKVFKMLNGLFGKKNLL